MPSKLEYPLKLTQLEVIELFKKGKYRVDPDKGLVLHGRTGIPLYTFKGGYKQGRVFIPDYSRKWTRLYSSPKSISLPVSHCIWLAMAQVPIPNRFEIHHKDLDANNDAWDNLFCLFEKDHRKLHADHRLVCNGSKQDF